jgi:hypothetical protein
MKKILKRIVNYWQRTKTVKPEMRQPGYYWCKNLGKWDIYKWCSGWYDLRGEPYGDAEIQEIDERIIKSRKL